MDDQSDLERIVLFEHARKTSEANYSEDPLDVEVCIILSSSNPCVYLFLHMI